MRFRINVIYRCRINRIFFCLCRTSRERDRESLFTWVIIFKHALHVYSLLLLIHLAWNTELDTSSLLFTGEESFLRQGCNHFSVFDNEHLNA